MKTKLTRIAMRTSLVYWTLAALWILLSDQALHELSSDPAFISRISMYKGWAFVTITALLLYISLRTQLFLWDREASRRKEAEEQIKYQAHLLANVNDAVLGMNVAFELTAWNQAAERIYGWRAEEVLGRPAFDVLQPVFIDSGMDQTKAIQLLKQSGHFSTNVLHTRKDGTTVTMEVRAAAIIDDNGIVTGYVAVNRDISERTRAEETIRTFALIPAENPNPIIRIAQDGRILYTNPACTLLTDWSLEPGGPAPALLKELALNALSTQTAQREEIKQNARVYSLFAAPIPDAAYANIYFLDITDRTQAEVALRSSQQKFSSAFRISPDALNINRLSDGLYLEVNQGFTSITGYTADDVIGKTSVELNIWTDIKDRERLVRELRDSGEVKDFEATFRMKDGSIRIGLMSARVIEVNGEECILSTTRDITERKKAEESLRRSEAKFRSYVEHAPLGVVIADATGRFVDVNSVSARMLGYTPAELIGLHIHDVSASESLDASLTSFEETRRTGGFSGELLLRRKDGSGIWVSLHTAKLDDNHFIAYCRDVTERKRAEELLKTREALLSSAVKMARMGHWEYDIAADRYTFNDYFYSLFKTSVQDVGGYTMSAEEYSRRFVHPEDFGFIRDEVKKAFETKDPYYEREIEHRVICADGSIGYISVRFFIVMNEDGQPIKTYGVSQDITERKKAERQIQLLASTLGSTQDCVSVTDMDDKIIYVNDSFLQTYGYSADELIGQHVSLLRSPLTPVEVIQELLPASLAGGWSGELMNRRKDGTDFPIELWTSVVRDRNGASVAMVGVARDITGRKRAEEALRQSEERLRMLIEGSDDIMIMQDLEGRYLHYSSAKHYAIAPESVVGKLPSDIHEPLTAAMLTERHKRVIATGQSVTQDDSIQWRGEQMWFSSQVSPVYDATGAIIATVSISHNITKRKRAEEALRRNEELFRNVFNQQFQFMTLLSPEGRVLAVNDLALEVGNLKRDEYIGKVFWKTPAWKLKPEWQEIWPARLKRAEKSDHPVLTEDSFLTADGSVRYAHFATSAVRKPDGKPAFFIVQATDITEQRNAETAMHQSEERFRDLVESLKEVVFRTDARSRWRFLNVAWTEVTGFAVDDCLDRDYLDFVHPDDRERSVQAFTPLLEGNVPFIQREIRCLHKDGGFRWVEVRARLTLDDNGNSIGMSGTLSDVTERRQAEIALRENEHALRKSQEVGGLGSYVFDARTGHWQSSLMLDRIFGIGDSFNKDVDGWLHLVHPSSRKEMAEYFMTHVLANHNTFDREYRIIRHDDGTERWVHGIGKLEFDDHQNPIRMIGTIRDITDRKLAEEEIMKSNIQLRQLSAHLESVREEERKHISREIHDELGQELTALKMEAVLLQKATSRGDQPEVRAMIRDHATSLSGITDRAIRTVRRIASELRPDLLDKLGLVAALEWHAKEFEKHSQIECAFTSDLDGETIDETVATAIFRIFQEALTNVGRHSGASHVRSELTRRRRNLVLRVEDNGRGISEAQILYSKSLGLLGMSERALMLGGKATVHGKDGQGTVVEVEIPIFAED